MACFQHTTLCPTSKPGARARSPTPPEVRHYLLSAPSRSTLHFHPALALEADLHGLCSLVLMPCGFWWGLANVGHQPELVKRKDGKVGVFVCIPWPGLPYRVPQTGWLIYNRHLFLPVLEAGCPKPRCQQVWFPLRSLSLACRARPFSASSHGLSSLGACSW